MGADTHGQKSALRRDSKDRRRSKCGTGKRSTRRRPTPRATRVPKAKIGRCSFVDFGKNMQHSPDGKAYLVAQGDTRPNPQTAYAACDQAYLLRVKPSPTTMNNPRAYEFFGGRGKDGKPIWTSDFKKMQPLLEWNDHMDCVTVTYDPPLKKYLMWITDSRGPNNDCRGAFRLLSPGIQRGDGSPGGWSST